jgi:murein DD-endopeptidase MepM/ murein hydrolase activator NlpD
VRRAELLRDRLRSSLGLPIPAGLRVCPFEQAVVLDEDWGDPRGWRSHKGNDINAPEGTRLVAMERGEVIQMGSHYLGGDGLYLRGDATGDVYYYAHLSGYAEGIEVGAPVIAGQVIAYVGTTGNADVPHLHLGWMPAAGGVDLEALTDAHELLRGLCG